MKKQVVKVNLKGSRQTLIVDFNELELGRCCYYLGKWGKVIIEVSEKLELVVEKNCIAIVPLDENREKIGTQANFIPINKIGNFENHIDPGSGDEFTLELIEMDEKELEKLSEFEGW